MSRSRCILVFAVLLIASGIAPAVSTAGPPSYLLLRQPESPGPKMQPGHAAAAHYDVRSQGYAYGYFGVAPRAHCSRHFGIYRTYTQWSRW